MKKLNVVLGTFMVAMIAILASCNPTEETIVTITVNPSVDSVLTVDAGATYDFVVTLTPDAVEGGEVGQFVIAEGSTVLVDTTYGATSTVTYNFSYKVADDATEGTTIDLSVEATDAISGQRSTESINLTVGAPLSKIVDVASMTLNYDNGSGFAASTPMIKITKDTDNATVNFEVVTPTGSGDVALGFQNTYGNAICSPDAKWIEDMYTVNGQSYSATGQKHTKLMKFTGDYATLTLEDLEALVVTEEFGIAGVELNGVAVSSLVAGDFVAFETADGVKGIFKITAKSGNQKGTKATSSLTCEGKVLYDGSSTAK